MNSLRSHIFARTISAAALLTGAAGLHADQSCPLQTDNETGGAVEASAERFTAHADGRALLSGAARIEQGETRIHADSIAYEPDGGWLQANGNVIYTNCAKKDPTWYISADRFTLDRERGIGIAKDAWLVVGDLPVFYLPRYHLSLEGKRKSGFLSPDIGIDNKTGVEFDFPYYFNLAPNHDALFEPRVLTKHGVQFTGRYRYLHRFHEGRLKGDWLDDSEYDDGKRHSYSLRHRTKFGDKLRMQLHLQRVSDDNYIKDLSGSFNLIGENYLNSTLLTDYVWDGWHLNVVAENFQRTDEDTEREDALYERRPSVSLSKTLYAPRLNLDLGLRTEWTDFEHKYRPQGDDTDTGGQRSDSEITLRWPYRRGGFHFTPSAAMRHTNYRLKENREESRTLPWFALRTGLVFEKPVRNARYRHTIEPELFYLNVPRRDQEHLPVFDTSTSEIRFSQLFEENRYNGADRIGDADRLTLALSTRLLDSRSGRETLRFSVGYTEHFRNQRVALPDEDEPVNNRRRSDLASELALNFNEKMHFTSSLVWDTEKEDPQRHSTRLALNAGDNTLVNLAHHYRRGGDGFNQGEIGFHLPLGTRWRWFGGWRYALRESKNLGYMAGLRYESCCWSVRLGMQRLLYDIDGADRSIANGSLDYNTTVGGEFSLRGLTRLGTNLDSGLLKRWLPYYRPSDKK